MWGLLCRKDSGRDGGRGSNVGVVGDRIGEWGGGGSEVVEMCQVLCEDRQGKSGLINVGISGVCGLVSVSWAVWKARIVRGIGCRVSEGGGTVEGGKR